uniref:Gustatory receptor n=1 Tax=Timema poppense TaxID=170557 RepID=A0A7R9H5A3_TIMPO|nr:unnamed protein product [Timema poppensis]
MYKYDLTFAAMFVMDSTIYLAQIHFMFLVMSVREHLSYINRRLEYSVGRNYEVMVQVEHHAGIVNVARLVNEAYSVQVLTTVTSVFILVTTFTFILLQDFIHRGQNFEVVKVVAFSSWIIFLAWRLYSCVYVCESTTSKANETAHLVHGLMRYTKDALLLNELKQFSLQLLHSRIQFTACGLFPLDYSLIHSIVAASTMYFIIQIQFQLSSKTSCVNTCDIDLEQCIILFNSTNSDDVIN